MTTVYRPRHFDGFALFGPDDCDCSDCTAATHPHYQPRHEICDDSSLEPCFWGDCCHLFRAHRIVAAHSLPETAPRTSTGEGVASFSSSRQNDATNPPT